MAFSCNNLQPRRESPRRAPMRAKPPRGGIGSSRRGGVVRGLLTPIFRLQLALFLVKTKGWAMTRVGLSEMANILGVQPWTLVKVARAKLVPHKRNGDGFLLFDPVKVKTIWPEVAPEVAEEDDEWESPFGEDIPPPRPALTLVK